MQNPSTWLRDLQDAESFDVAQGPANAKICHPRIVP
jgi:hypothetical protein